MLHFYHLALTILKYISIQTVKSNSMKIVSKIAVIVCMLFGSVSAQQPSTKDAIVGTWTVQDGSAKVKIEMNSGKYSGRLVWIKNPNDAKGKPVVDSKNPDVSLRNRPQLGLSLLRDFVYDDDNVWTDGSIYNPDDGKTYSCKITMKNSQTIEVRGYVGISLFGKTETWKRAEDITMK